MLIWLWPLPVLLSFAVAGLLVLCLDWDHLVALIDDGVFMSPYARYLMSELERKAELADRLADQERDYHTTRRQITDAARRYRGWL